MASADPREAVERGRARRPDLGRLPADLSAVPDVPADVGVVLADGLSPTALMHHGASLLEALIAELAHGFELSTNPADGRPWTVVVDKVVSKNTDFIAREVRFVRQLTDRELDDRLKEAKQDLWQARFALSTRQLKDYSSIPATRRTIARILTVQRERATAPRSAE